MSWWTIHIPVEGCFSYFDELQYLYYLLDKIVQINIKM